MTDTKKQRRAMRQVQQALRKDPNDIGALLGWAALLGTSKPERDQKRNMLQRVLSLERDHPRARKMLFEMDRAEIGGNPARLSLAVILNDGSSSTVPQSPLILKYSVAHRLIVYFFLACALVAGFGFSLVFLLVPLWIVSVVIEINDSGLKVSRLFGWLHSEISWKEIREIKELPRGRGVRVVSGAGKAVTVSARMNGYPFILDILRQARPDLFGRPQDSQSSATPASAIAARASKAPNKVR